MIITILQTVLKILLFAVLFALEISVAIPVVSLLFLFFITLKSKPASQLVLLAVGSLIVSSFTGISWSLVALLFGVFWVGTQELAKTWLHQQNAALLASLVLAGLLAQLAAVSFNYKTVVYTIALTAVAVVISRWFLPKRMRHSVTDWISPGKV